MSLIGQSKGPPDIEFRVTVSFRNDYGIIRGIGDEMDVVEEAVPGLSVIVKTGRGQVGNRFAQVKADVTPADITPPTGGVAGDIRRIDLAQLTRGGTGVNFKAGTESATPSAPTPDANSLPVGILVLRKGMTTILNSDDSNNGFIVKGIDTVSDSPPAAYLLGVRRFL